MTDFFGKLKTGAHSSSRIEALPRRILDDFGCDAEKTYFDVPRMRSSTSDNYLTTGIAFAWHPHRDTSLLSPSLPDQLVVADL